MIAKTNIFSYYLIVFVFTTVLSAQTFSERGRGGIPPPNPLLPPRPSGFQGFGKIASAIFLKMGSCYIQNIPPSQNFSVF